MNFKLGKLPPKRLMSTPSLGDFLPKATSWPAVPPQGWEAAVPKDQLDILGNDVWGDCAEAGLLHLLQAQSYNAGRPLIPTTTDASRLYSAVTGFDPNAPLVNGVNPTDQGSALIDVLTYAQKTGVTIGNTIHKIVGFASLDITSMAQIRYATYLFGGRYIGINCPAKCQQDLTNWNFGPGLPIDGGHCIVQVGEGGAGGQTSTWGMTIPTSNEFYLSYQDESYIIVTQDWLNAQGKTPTGLDLNGLLAAMKAL
jgi:hypothetical protein